MIIPIGKLVKFVYRCGIVGLTGIKQEALDTEYDNLQTFLQTGEDGGLYSANKQQALRFYGKKEQKQYPISVRNDLLRLDTDRENKEYKYWARIPLKAIRGGCWIALKPHKPIDYSAKICESKIKRFKNGRYELQIVMEKEIPLRKSYSNIISIDIGAKNIATSVEFATGRTMFYSDAIKRVRGHYFHLRKKLGQKKALRTITKIGHTEKRKVTDLLHKLTKEIVNKAIETNSLIAVGILAGVRKKKGKLNRKGARKISFMPSHKFTEMLKYKAEQVGIMVIETYEGYTSKTCSCCGNYGIRKSRDLVRCNVCGYQDNADRNGAINIGKRVLQYICNIGALVNMPELRLWNAKHFSDLRSHSF